MTRRAAIVLCMACVAFIAPACKRKPAPPPSVGPRIVALSPAAQYVLRDLDLDRNFVGRHAFGYGPWPIVGDQNGVDYEALLRANPTHIIIQWGKRDLPSRLVELAGANHWEIIPFDPLTLDEIVGDTKRLESIFHDTIRDNNFHHGGPPPPPLIPRMERAWQHRDGLYAGRVLLLESAAPPAALGPGSFHAQVLERIGGTPAIVNGNPYMRLDAEDVLKLAPDAIVLVIPRTGDAPPADPKSLLGALASLDIPAVRENRVALIDDPLALTPSSAMIEFADRLAEILAKWR